MDKKLYSIALGGVLALILSGCVAQEAPTVTPEPTQEPAPASSTLDGGVVHGDGVTVRQLSEAPEGADELTGPVLIKESDTSFIFESGGSSSPACLVNFTGIERDGDNFNLDYRVGLGEPDLVCTMDYKSAYFLVETEEPVSSSSLINFFQDGEQLGSIGFSSAE